jgi:hypothetical protein
MALSLGEENLKELRRTGGILRPRAFLFGGDFSSLNR